MTVHERSTMVWFLPPALVFLVRKGWHQLLSPSSSAMSITTKLKDVASARLIYGTNIRTWKAILDFRRASHRLPSSS